MSKPSVSSMRRRRYLLSVGTVVGSVGLSGCSGGDENNTDRDSSPTDTPDDRSEENAEPTETQTPTPEIEPSAEVVDSEVFTAPFLPDGDGDDVPWIRVDVSNDTDVPHRQLRVETRLRSADGSILGTREGYTVV